MSVMLSGHGPTEARVMLIADGGSDADVTNERALTGDQERELRYILKSLNAGIYFDEFWKTALIKERINLQIPDANRDLLTDQYKEILLNEIAAVRPNVLVPLSELGFNFLTGLKGIRKFRGSVLPTDPALGITKPNIRVLPTLGPNPYLYQDPKQKFITRIDFSKIARNQHNTDPIREIGNVWICETGTALRAFLNRCYPGSKFVVFDIETFANCPTCISFCFDGLESCCVPILDYHIPLDQRAAMLQLVLKLMNDPIPKVNQNIKFDWRKLHRIGWNVTNVKGDTMLAQNLLYCEFPKNLGFLTSIYTDMPYFKDEGKEFDPAKYDRKKLYIYNAKDSLATWQIHAQQLEEIEEKGVKHPWELLMDILPIYREMEENGLLVDDLARRKLLNKYWVLYNFQVAKLCKLVGREINPLSSLVVGKLVYDDLKWEPIRGLKKKKDGGYSADEENLEMLMWKSHCNSNLGVAILRSIIDCRKLHKVIEILELPTYPDGRHRCEFNLAGSENGRTTAAETTDYFLEFDGKKIKLVNLGHSFQTIGKHGFTVDGVEYGKDIRTIFVPSPGFCFVEVDLSQAEARVDAVLAKDYDILSYFDGPIGIHRLTGSWVYDCPPEQIRKNELTLDENGVGVDRYTLSKVVRHAAERNMKEDRLMMMLHRPFNECTKILKRVHDKQPNIRNVFHREVREAVRNKELVAPNGRRRDFYGKFDDGAVNEGISFLPQAIVTDYLKEGIRRTIPNCREHVRPISEAHDGFLVEVRIGHEHDYASDFQRNVEKPINFERCTLSRDFELTIPSEAEVSYTNWKNMEGIGK